MALISFIGNLLLSSSIAFLGISLLLQQGAYQPVYFTLAPPPSFEGVLEPKAINSFEYLLKGSIGAPESIYVDGNTLYTGLNDGRVVKIVDGVIKESVRYHNFKNCDGSAQTIGYCGRPLGIRRLSTDVFLIADPQTGIYSVDFKTGATELFFAANTLLEGKPAMFIDDLDIVDNDTIIFSDASTKFDMLRFMKPILEHAGDGRVIMLKLSTRKAKVLLDGLNFPNGIQVHSDRQSVLISETGQARVLRYHFDGPKKGQYEVFADNLPGFPDNVRESSTGTYFVALAIPRHPEDLSLLDKTAQRPWIRKLVGELSEYEIFTKYFVLAPKHGLFVELSKSGDIIASYHDPTGKYIREISQITDDGKNNLYLGSYNNDFIVRLRKKTD
jgi:sugar lactone lactonase YvrE